MSRTLEIVGFLCRWCLLAVAGITVVAVAWFSVMAATEAPRRWDGEMVFGDVLWMRDTPVNMMSLGYALPPLRNDNEPVLLCQGPDGQVSLVWMRALAGRATPLEAGGAQVHLDRPAMGVNVVRLVGVPYGHRAFQSVRLNVLVLPSDRPVLLLDAKTLLPLAQNSPEGARGLIDALAGGGEMVWIASGPQGEFVRLRRELRRVAPEAPLVLVDTASQIGRGRLRVFLRQSNALSAPVALVTADELLAANGAALRLTTHLIAPAQAAAPSITRHSSLAKFKDYVHTRPIGQ